MDKPPFTPTPRDYRAAVSLNTFLIAVSFVAIAVMVTGLAFADSWIELMGWLAAAVWSVLAICALAFLAGLHGGRRRG